MSFLLAAITTGVGYALGGPVGALIGYAVKEKAAGTIGEMNAPGDDKSSPEFKKRQAIREYNDLLDRTDPSVPAGTPNLKCIADQKAKRREDRKDLIRKTQSKSADENDPKKKQMNDAANRLAKDMDRVEDAKLSLYTYTANEDLAKQEEFLKPLREQPPPGFKNATSDQVANDFGVDAGKLTSILNKKNGEGQRIMIYERDETILGPGPKYTVAFRGSTSDKRDWHNNGLHEAGYEAPHQQNAIALGKFLAAGAAEQDKPITDLISATGHSKGGSEAQAFEAASRSTCRVFNPAGFDPKQYGVNVDPKERHVDQTIIVSRNKDGKLIESTKTVPYTDPLHYAQQKGMSQYVMVKPVSNEVRELAPINPNYRVPSEEQSETEAHSMLQVIEALERDKEADQNAMKDYVK